MHAELFDKQMPKRKCVELPSDVENEDLDDHGAFGYLRGARDRAINFEVRHKDGKITANAYGWLESAEFDPSEGITLNFSGKIVKLIGRNLNSELRPNVRLFAGILRQRVPWVQEADGPAMMESSRSAVIIEEVKVDSLP